jgi:DNA-binding transcriptional ArsR family regulator
MADWIDLPAAPACADELVLTDLELVTEIAHPVRSAILFRLRRPHSAAELATAMGVPVTRLYHHLNHLETAGLITVVATRRSGAKTERRYRNVASRFRLDPAAVEQASNSDVMGMLGAMFDVTKSELRREFEVGALPPETLRGLSTSGINQLRLTRARRDEFVDRLWTLLEEYVDDADENAETADDEYRFRIFVAGFPVTG